MPISAPLLSAFAGRMAKTENAADDDNLPGRVTSMKGACIYAWYRPEEDEEDKPNGLDGTTLAPQHKTREMATCVQ